MFELHQIKQLVTVADCGTISKAAEKLNITQPALSRSLQNLEYELKTPLFARSKNKVSLTETGIHAVELSKELLSQAELMLGKIQEFYKIHTKMIIASCAPCDILFQLRDLVCESFSGIECETIVDDEDEILTKLSQGIYHMALFSESQKNEDLIQIPVQSEKLFAMIPEEHFLATKKDGLFFSDINGEAVIPFPLKGHWNDLLAQKLPDSQLLYQSNVESFDKVVHASNLISFESDLLTIDIANHVRIPILDPEAQITYHFAILKSNKEQFSKLMQKIFASVNG
ncbi:LysR family transcriptional regulator [Treponema sp.]|uniref:LysR family transcriptional regulator n=1 Tax=Treponema sp. TaxID=166 RepID=UPI0025EE2709|nr:LysR family transcriptional regulator [Treponema sp.]MBR4321288.1 LysR family transcriptional regulator [Treponema sp.]